MEKNKFLQIYLSIKEYEKNEFLVILVIFHTAGIIEKKKYLS